LDQPDKSSSNEAPSEHGGLTASMVSSTSSEKEKQYIPGSSLKLIIQQKAMMKQRSKGQDPSPISDSIDEEDEDDYYSELFIEDLEDGSTGSILD